MTNHREDEYRPGSIRRIKLTNFLTHGNVEFHPGPRLNMVIGANGTGKSTILNAICLGLGGEPKLLGRADDLRAFIMHGKPFCDIEIELAPWPDKPVHILRRHIDRSKGSERGRGRGASTFFINSDKVHIKDVRELVEQTYSCQISNLCTFLPQDKVGNFSGFSDQDRLLETEKTLSKDQYFYNTHQQLIEKEAAISQDIGNVESIKDTLKKKQHEFERLEVNKAREEERLKAEQYIDLLQKKKVWLQFEAYREKAINLKEQKGVLRKQLQEKRADMAPLEEEQARLQTKKKQLDAQYKKHSQSVDKAKKEMEKQNKKHENHDDELENLQTSLMELDSKRDAKVRKLEAAQDRLQSLQADLSNNPDYDELNQEFDVAKDHARSTKREFDAVKRRHRTMVSQFEELEQKAGHTSRKLVQLNDERRQRQERIFRSNQNLRTICEWIDNNRQMFRKPVFGPVAAEISPDTATAAACFEFHVANKVLFSFVVQCDEDKQLLYNEIRVNQGRRINIIDVAGQSLATTRKYSDAKMRVLKDQHGVVGYLDETFQAPDAVMIAVQKFARVHDVLIGSAETQKSIDERNLKGFLAEPESAFGQSGPQGSCIFVLSDNSDLNRFTQTVSRYSKKISTKEDTVGPPKMLGRGADPAYKQRIEDELKRLHDEIKELRPEFQKTEKEKKDLEMASQDIHLKAQALKDKLKLIKKTKDKVKAAQQKVETCKQDLEVDETEEKRDLAKHFLKRFSHTLNAIEAHGDQHSVMMKCVGSNAGIEVSRQSVVAEERIASEKVIDARKDLDDLETAVKRAKADFDQAKRDLTTKKTEADEIAPLSDESGNELPLKSMLESLDVQSEVEVDAAIEDEEQKLSQFDANPEVIRQYEKLKDEIALIEQQLMDSTDVRERSLETIADQRKDWEERLGNLVTKVNANFSVYMSEMGCTGEVRLTKGNQEVNSTGNFKDWGIEIKVSFREGAKAEVLSAQRHSGGERSVSTILYLMALQKNMVAPFLCVDEINQGLDERNERLVFRRIVANSTKPPTGDDPSKHSGQYWLITPKLLPFLTDMEQEAMTILFVFNGPFNFKSNDEWNIDKMIPGHSSGEENSVPRKKSRLSED